MVQLIPSTRNNFVLRISPLAGIISNVSSGTPQYKSYKPLCFCLRRLGPLAEEVSQSLPLCWRVLSRRLSKIYMDCLLETPGTQTVPRLPFHCNLGSSLFTSSAPRTDQYISSKCSSTSNIYSAKAPGDS